MTRKKPSQSLVDDFLRYPPYNLRARLPFNMRNELLNILFIADFANHQPRLELFELDSLNLLFSRFTDVTEPSFPRTPKHYSDHKAALKNLFDGSIDIRHRA